MPAPIGTLVADAITKAQLSRRAFCRLIAYDQGSLQGVIAGNRPPPRDQETNWADALGLKGQARHDFLVAYWLAHAPSQLAAEIDRLRAAAIRGRGLPSS